MDQEERYRRLVGLPGKHKVTVPDTLREVSGQCGVLTCKVCNRLAMECFGKCSEWPAKLAGRIEQEAQEIYEAGMRAGAESDFAELDWEEWGWPRPLPTENLREYVERCMVVMPRDSDGNLWRINDVAVVEGKNVTVSIVAFGSECVCTQEFNDKSMEFDGPFSFLHPWQLERPPEMLCADGEPPHLGEEVWLVDSLDKSYLVIGVYPNRIMLRENCESLPFDVLPQSVSHHKGAADMDGRIVNIGDKGYAPTSDRLLVVTGMCEKFGGVVLEAQDAETGAAFPEEIAAHMFSADMSPISAEGHLIFPDEHLFVKGTDIEVAVVGLIPSPDGTMIELDNGKTVEARNLSSCPKETVGYDGEPIEVGQTVYDRDGMFDFPMTVLGIDGIDVKVSMPGGKGWTNFVPQRLTHVPLEKRDVELSDEAVGRIVSAIDRDMKLTRRKMAMYQKVLDAISGKESGDGE